MSNATPSRVLRGGVTHRPVVLDVAGPEATFDPVVIRQQAEDMGYSDGYDKGYVEGVAQGRAAAEQRAAAAAQEQDLLVRRAVAALEAAADALSEKAVRIAAADEAALTRHAVAIAEAVVGRECRSFPGALAVERALALRPSGVPVTVLLHPDDIAAAGDAPAGVTFTADPSVDLGGFEVSVPDDGYRIDGRITAALDRVREVLAGQASPDAEQAAA